MKKFKHTNRELEEACEKANGKKHSRYSNVIEF